MHRQCEPVPRRVPFMAALLTALAIVLAGFVYPPVQSPGISLTRANSGDSDTPVADHLNRDAEEDAAAEHDLKDRIAGDPAVNRPQPPQLDMRQLRPEPDAAWPASGRPRGLKSVRGPPA